MIRNHSHRTLPACLTSKGMSVKPGTTQGKKHAAGGNGAGIRGYFRHRTIRAAHAGASHCLCDFC